jgi:UDP-glucose 4-epimerase
MKITVFGGAGFLGSHSADQLSLAGHEVTVFDLKPSPFLRADQKMLIGDILDAETVGRAVAGADVVYNYAGIADITEANRRPVDTVSYNVLGNVKILEASRLAGIKRYIFASTLYVYGKSGGFYRCSKQASEFYVENYWNEFKLPYTMLRYGSLYGPRADKRNGIYKFVRQAMADGRINYNGTPDALREYIHVEDAAKCSVEILNDSFINSNIVLTGGQAMRVADLFKMITEILGRDIEIKYRSEDDSHYDITPYSFHPRIGHKMSPPCSIDLGQGVLSVMEEVYKDLNPNMAAGGCFPFLND